MGVGPGVGGCQPFETIQGGPTPPLSWPVGVSGPEKGSAKRKGFLLRLLCLAHVKWGRAGVLLFSHFSARG